MVKLLPGEKMIYKDHNTTVVLDSHSQQQRYHQGAFGMFNPPKLDSGSNNNKILKSFKKKHLQNNINGMMQFPQFINPGQMNNIPNNIMMNMINGNMGQGMNMNNMGQFNMNGINPMNQMNMPNIGGFPGNHMPNMGNFYNGNGNNNIENFALNNQKPIDQAIKPNQFINNNSNLINTMNSSNINTPNFSFKQKPVADINTQNNQNNIQKDFLEMKNQFSKMMVSLFINNIGKSKGKRIENSNAKPTTQPVNVF